MRPQRIQRRRAKGWQMPDNAVYVGRPTKWGNPFVVGQDGTRKDCLDLYWYLVFHILCISKSAEHVEAQQRVRRAMNTDLRELRGKDLACWCPLDKPCHADCLLVIANLPERIS